MTIVVGTGGAKSRFLKRNWPITEGLTGGTTKQEGTKDRLEPVDEDLTTNDSKKGLY